MHHYALLALLVAAPSRPAAHAAPPCPRSLRWYYSPAKRRRMRLGMQLAVMRYHREQRALAYEILARHGSPSPLTVLPDDLAAAEQGRFGDDLKHSNLVGATYCQ